ncbi:hypothetical protein [Algihabitans albus]|uniref:hypothetical protein n=1 Tax=Algihabitans albus TaxID=2164067 RepID=UPI000E5C8AC3|nr:hypothetical protein [Algihabitans albus]
MTRLLHTWFRRTGLIAVLSLAALGLLIARAPERSSEDPDPAALTRMVAERAATLANLPADAGPLRRAEAETMLADAQRTLAQLDGAPGAAEAALELYVLAGRRLRSAAGSRQDLLGHVELHRGEVLTLLGRHRRAAAAYRSAIGAFSAAGQPVLAEVAQRRLSERSP